MSTKIYDAYKYNGTLDELVADLEKIRLDYVNVIEQFVGAIMPDYLKENPQYVDDEGNIEKRKILHVIEEQLNKSYPSYDDIFCFNASAVLYPIEGQLLTQFFGFDVAPFGRQFIIPTLDELKKSGKLVDYHYQNQADPWYAYEDLEGEKLEEAEKDYAERERLWDIVFKTHWSANEAGFVKDFKLKAYTIMDFIPDDIKLEVSEEITDERS